MIQDDMRDSFYDLKEDVKEYVENRITFTKLHVVESLSKFSSGFAVKLGVLYLLFFALMFISLALAFFLGNLLDSNTLGFTIVALIYSLLALIFYAMRRKWVEKPIIKNYVHLFFPNFNGHEDQK